MLDDIYLDIFPLISDLIDLRTYFCEYVNLK